MFRLALLWIWAEAFLSVSVLNLITIYIMCTAGDNSFDEMNSSTSSSFTSYITSPILTPIQHIARIPQMLFNLTLSSLPIRSALAVTVERINYSPHFFQTKDHHNRI